MKIAILTIHKILNYGSTLQAYALQFFIEKNIPNSSATIIDYKFPNQFHWKERYRNESRYRIWRNRLHRIKENLIPCQIVKQIIFQRFWKENYHLSHKYSTPECLFQNPPIDYDVHVLGSDQVWNTKTLCGDAIFLFSYLSDRDKCFSYASSFGVTHLPDEFSTLFKKHLSKFRAIGVREKDAVRLLSNLGIQKNIHLVCDPTLLLKADDYKPLASKSKYTIDGDYILVYCLQYAFNPYPAIRNVIERLQKQYDYKVVFVNRVVKGEIKNSQKIKTAGPYDFLYLFRNAKIVVTSSFHGTAFSIINRKPFVSIAPRNGDNRIEYVLSRLGLCENLVFNDQKDFMFNPMPYTAEVEKNIESYVNESKEFLITNIYKSCNDGKE